MEGQFTADPKKAVQMLANFAPGDLPSKVKAPSDVGNADAAKKAIEQTKDNDPGQTAYMYKTGDSKSSKQAVATGAAGQKVMYRGSGFNPQGSPQTVFTKDEWDATIAEYESTKDNLAAQKPDGGDGVTDEMDAQAQTTLDPAGETEGQEQFLQANADARAVALDTAFVDRGFGTNPTAWKAQQRQSVGLGAKHQLWQAQQHYLRSNNLTAGDVEKASQDIEAAQMKALQIHDKMGPLHDVSKLTTDDKEFLRTCLKLRGTGQNRGVWLKGGDNCGGDLAAIGYEALDGGEVYGVKIGTDKHPMYELAEKFESVEDPDTGKPLIRRGRNTDAATQNAWSNVNGTLNEFAIISAHCMYVVGAKDIKKGKKCMEDNWNRVKKTLGDKYDIQLFTQIAEAHNGGGLEEFEVASPDEEGMLGIVKEIAEEEGETPDAKKALAWVMARGMRRWKVVVESMPECMQWDQTGLVQSGIRDGQGINQDIAGDCGKPGMPDEVYNRIRNNADFDVKEGREDEESTIIQATVKDSRRTSQLVDQGKRSMTKLRSDNEDVAIVRDKQQSLIERFAEAVGQALPDGWRGKAEEARRKEIGSVDGILGAVAALDGGSTEEVQRFKRRQLSFVEAEKVDAFYNDLKKWRSEKDPKAKRKLKRQLMAKLTNAHRAKEWKKGGESRENLRYHLATESMVTGVSTEREAAYWTAEDGTWEGLETDYAGPQALGMLGLGEEGKDSTLEFNQDECHVVLADGIKPFSLVTRVKDGQWSQFVVTNKKWGRSKLRRLDDEASTPSTPVGDSGMKAEDFVRQLQELIKGIDKVLTA